MLFLISLIMNAIPNLYYLRQLLLNFVEIARIFAYKFDARVPIFVARLPMVPCSELCRNI